MFEAWRLDADEVKAREEALRERLRALSDEQRLAYHRRCSKRLKDPDTYAVLDWLFLAGLHHYYLGQHAAGTLNLAAMLAGVALLFVQPWAGAGLILLVFIAELPALLRSQTVVAEHNVRLGERILRELGHG
ncbi:MAG: TM2 domain-containing protein [Gammaproteobacteria bacterium]|nr:TM2 domain-containing protein [Gammaproteobacteria bacterium]